jgi:hypothetical protein
MESICAVADPQSVGESAADASVGLSGVSTAPQAKD